VLVHGCSEASFAALARQELRWNATIAGIDPAGYAGSIVLHPLPLAILGWLIGGGAAGALAVALALAARGAASLAATRLDFSGRSWRDRLTALVLVPLRDLLSFTLFLASFAVRSVDWRGTSLNLGRQGRLAAREDQDT
jgi:ceramide glucosyltransferase